jgi:hypothetical protein
MIVPNGRTRIVLGWICLAGLRLASLQALESLGSLSISDDFSTIPDRQTSGLSI